MKFFVKFILVCGHVSLVGSLACAQDDDGSWAEVVKLVKGYQAFDLIRVMSVSEQFVLNEEKTELERIISSEIEAAFGASAANPSRIKYLLRTAKWQDGAAPYFVEKKEHIFGADYFAIIKHASGGADDFLGNGLVLKENAKVEIDLEPQNPRISNRLEVGDGFLLLRQYLFGEIPIVEALGEGGRDRDMIIVKVEVEEFDEEQCIALNFSRTNGARVEDDRLLLSPKRGLALVHRRLVSQVGEGFANELKALGEKVPAPVESVYSVSDWLDLGGAFLPRSLVYQRSHAGVTVEKIVTKLSVVENANIAGFDISEITVPAGYKVEDRRIGITYEAGGDGIKVLEDLKQRLDLEKK